MNKSDFGDEVEKLLRPYDGMECLQLLELLGTATCFVLKAVPKDERKGMLQGYIRALKKGLALLPELQDDEKKAHPTH